MNPPLVLIAAMDENRLLANENRLPWHLPWDVAQFRQRTRKGWLLMGRKTYEEMRGWFNDEQHVLIFTSAANWQSEPGGGHAVSSVSAAVKVAAANDAEELLCLGGGGTFAAALPEASQMVLTHIRHRFLTGDQPVYFPAWKAQEWEITGTTHHAPDEKNAHPMDLVTYQRKSPEESP